MTILAPAGPSSAPSDRRPHAGRGTLRPRASTRHSVALRPASSVVIHPATRRVTHLVVEEKRFSHREHLVPIDEVVEATPRSIHLRCSRDELAAMDDFVETEYVSVDTPGLGDPLGLYGLDNFISGLTTLVPVVHELIPAGELAVRQGARVEATDGHVGRVDEFLVDPRTGRITHLVLREGHLWGQKDVTIPVSQVARLEEDAVYLKLDRRSVAALPAVPVGARALR